MKKAKKAISLGVVLAIAVTMLITPMGNSFVEGATTSTTNLVPKNAEKVSFEIESTGKVVLANDGNVLISADSPEEDCLPAITKDGSGNIVATWTHVISMMDADIGLAYSTDSGNTWEATVLGMDGYQWYADIAYMEGSKYEGPEWDGLWIESLDSLREAGNFVLITDITDPDTWEPYAWVDDSRPGATCLSLEDDMWYKEFHFDLTPGPVVGMINDDQGMDQGIELWWMAAGEDLGNIVYNWDSGTGPEGLYFPASDIDLAAIHDSDPAWTDDDFFYLVCQSNYQEKASILYKRCVPTIEDDIEFSEESYFLDGGETFDAEHPEVDASGDNVVVVYMTNDNVYGDWDIKCAYSSDHGTNWETSMVAEGHPINEVYPAVYMSGNTVFCAYIKEGNLYLVKSEDGGATWEDPEQINDEDGTVVEEENAVDIHPAGIVWTDNRNENKDIYFAPIPGARIEVTDISGGFGVSATITNVGTAEATDVGWTITVDATIGGGENTGTIETLSAGGEEPISSGFMLGLGPADITVTANGASATASGFMLGPFVLGVS